MNRVSKVAIVGLVAIVIYELLVLPILTTWLSFFYPLQLEVHILCYLIIGSIPVIIYVISLIISYKIPEPVSENKNQTTQPKMIQSNQDGRVSLGEIWFDAGVSYHKQEVRLYEIFANNDLANKLQALQGEQAHFIDNVLTQREYSIIVKSVDRRQINDHNQLNILLNRLSVLTQKSQDALTLDIRSLNHVVGSSDTTFQLAFDINNPTERSTTITRAYLDVKYKNKWLTFEPTTRPVKWDIRTSSSEVIDPPIQFYCHLPLKKNKIQCRIRLIHTLGEITEENVTSTRLDAFLGSGWYVFD